MNERSKSRANADPEIESSQAAIADAVTQTDAVLDLASGMSAGAMYQTFAHSAILMYQNAVAEQQRGSMAANSAVSMNLREMLDFGMGRFAVREAGALAGVSTAEQLDGLADLLQQIDSPE